MSTVILWILYPGIALFSKFQLLWLLFKLNLNLFYEGIDIAQIFVKILYIIIIMRIDCHNLT